MRLFFAVTLDEQVKKAVSKAQQGLATVPGARLIPAENLHITLRFLGDVPKNEVQALISGATLVRAEPATVSIGGPLSGFPRINRWTVAVIGVKDQTRLLTTIYNQLPAGSDNKRFVPHVTIARSSSEQPALPLVETEPVLMDINRFVLMESVLKPQGPLYRVLHTFPLK